MKYLKYIFALVLFFGLTGCVKDKESEQSEKAYAQFVRQREKMRYGADLQTLQKALQYYPAFRRSFFAGDITGFRQKARSDSLDFSEFIPALFMIMEIDDSSKTKTGRKYLEKKYNPKLIDYVVAQLSLRKAK
ncbi:hypothetical protein J7K99_00065 [bacterium]|nr:hypothetical protein [bacterium]